MDYNELKKESANVLLFWVKGQAGTIYRLYPRISYLQLLTFGTLRHSIADSKMLQALDKLFFHLPTAKPTSILGKTDQAMMGMASMLMEKGWVVTEMTSMPSKAWTTTQIASETPSTALTPPFSVVAIGKMRAMP